MQVITIKSSTTLAALTQQVFALRADTAAATLKRVQTALREANPHWGQRVKFPAGTVVIVPDVPGLPSAAPTGPVIITPTQAEQLKQVLAAAAAVLETSVITAMREIEVGVKLSQNADLLALAKEDADLRDRLVQIKEQAKPQIAAIAAAKAEAQKGLAQLNDDLAGLAR